MSESVSDPVVDPIIDPVVDDNITNNGEGPRNGGDGDAARPADIPNRPRLSSYNGDRAAYARDYRAYQKWAKSASGHITSTVSKQPTIAGYVDSGGNTTDLRPNASQAPRKTSKVSVGGKPAVTVNYRGVGESAAMILEVGGCAFFGGDEGKYKSTEEKEGIVSAFTEYAKSQNLTDIPPGILCLIVVAVYSAPRFASDGGRQRIEQIKALVKKQPRSLIPVSNE
jgi:hypothetical protein